jgi:hypothetical protein
MNKEFYADSALELFRMYQLDLDDDVVFWTKYHSIKIKYEFENEYKHYVPDFLIKRTSQDRMIVEEVKGYDIKAIAKKKALVNFCNVNNFNYNWITQDQLTKLGYREFLNKLNNEEV